MLQEHDCGEEMSLRAKSLFLFERDQHLEERDVAMGVDGKISVL